MHNYVWQMSKNSFLCQQTVLSDLACESEKVMIYSKILN